MSASVRIVVISYETVDDLRRCLRALRPSRPDIEVVVVDNASADGSAAMARAEFPHVQVIASPVNLGFAGGINRGLEGSAADYVLVLNPDVELRPEALRALLDFMEDSPEAAAVSPLLVGGDGEPQEHLYRRFPSLPQVLLFWTVLAVVAGRIEWLRKRFMEHRIGGVGPVPVDQLPGAAILMRAGALQAVGLWDPGYFIWWEDVDWCYRARKAERKLFVLPGVRARHGGGASFRSWTVRTRVLQFYRAFYRFLCKHHLHRLRRMVTPVLLIDLRVKAAILAIRRWLGFPHPEAVGSLAPVRRAIREAVVRCDKGELPVLGPAGGATGAAPAPPSSLASATESSCRGGGGRPPVDVVVVSWNARDYLPECLEALARSTLRPGVVVVDNASADGTADWVRTHHPDVTLMALDRNVGYAGGANAGIRESSAAYVMVMNPDIRLSERHLERLVDRLEVEPEIGAAQGRLWSVDRSDFLAGRLPAEPRLDSAGHVLRRTRMAYDRGQGRLGGPPWDREASVFSASGAAIILRRSMLTDVAPDGAPFDPAFFAYKEDVDLGWRARLFGWDIRYLPEAEAWHVRALPGPGRHGHGAPARARRHSWMNHWLMMVKNDRLSDVLRDLPWIGAWELARLWHALFRDPALLPAYLGVWSRLPDALRQRRFIQSARRVSSGRMRQWFGADTRAHPDLLDAEREIRT